MADRSGVSTQGGVVIIAMASMALALGSYRVIVGLMVREDSTQFDALQREMLEMPALIPVNSADANAVEAARQAHREVVRDRSNAIAERQGELAARMDRAADRAAAVAVAIGAVAFIAATAAFIRQSLAARPTDGPGTG